MSKIFRFSGLFLFLIFGQVPFAFATNCQMDMDALGGLSQQDLQNVSMIESHCIGGGIWQNKDCTACRLTTADGKTIEVSPEQFETLQKQRKNCASSKTGAENCRDMWANVADYQAEVSEGCSAGTALPVCMKNLSDSASQKALEDMNAYNEENGRASCTSQGAKITQDDVKRCYIATYADASALEDAKITPKDVSKVAKKMCKDKIQREALFDGTSAERKKCQEEYEALYEKVEKGTATADELQSAQTLLTAVDEKKSEKLDDIVSTTFAGQTYDHPESKAMHNILKSASDTNTGLIDSLAGKETKLNGAQMSLIKKYICEDSTVSEEDCKNIDISTVDSFFDSLKGSESALSAFNSYASVSALSFASTSYNSSKLDGFFKETLEKYLSSKNNYGCWFCPLFAKAYSSISIVCTELFNKFKDLLLPFLALGIAFWLLFQVIKYITIFQGADPAEFFTTLSKGLFKGIVAVALLSAGPSFIYGKVLSPVFETSAIFAQKILESDTSWADASYLSDDISMLAKDPCATAYQTKIDLPTDSVFNETSFRTIDCLLRTASSRLMVGLAVGTTMIRICFGDWGAIIEFFRSLDVFMMGIIIFLGHFVLLVVLPLKFVDILIHLAFVGALLPLFIIAWVFPATAGYAKKAFSIFVGAVFTFITLALTLIIALRIMTFALPTASNAETLQNLNGTNEVTFTCESGMTCNFFEFISEDPQPDKLREQLNFSSVELFLGIMAMFFAFKLIDMAPDIAKSVTDFSAPSNSVGGEINKKGTQVVGAGAHVAGGAVISVAALSSTSIKNSIEKRKNKTTP
ncbi:MAG: hypothetical protein EOM53_01225 [Alphaproteobacteria bacterium]|nr:hypothetical protein [Alphaproteobacteria bacterium]